MDFFTHVTVLAALAVVAVTQILKLNLVPLKFANNHPVPTNIVLSVVAAIFVDWKNIQHVSGWTNWVGTVAIIAVTAAIVYNQLLGRWTALKAMEGPGTPN